jgi:hypothetical protein
MGKIRQKLDIYKKGVQISIDPYIPFTRRQCRAAAALAGATSTLHPFSLVKEKGKG